MNRLAGLRRIGIDEISYKRGHRYLSVVVDHHSRRLVWAAAGRDKATPRRFFDLLSPERCGAITHVMAMRWSRSQRSLRSAAAGPCAVPTRSMSWPG